jgi:hypothetical protein
MVAVLRSELTKRISGASWESRLNGVDLRRDCAKDFVDELLLAVADSCHVDSLVGSFEADFRNYPVVI